MPGGGCSFVVFDIDYVHDIFFILFVGLGVKRVHLDLLVHTELGRGVLSILEAEGLRV